MLSIGKMSNRQIFSERLRELRLLKGLKGAEMADFIGVSAPVYSRYEHGRIPEINVVTAISKKFGVTLDWLLGSDRSDSSIPVPTRSATTPRSPETDGACRIPAGCDLPARLDEMEKEMGIQRKQLDDIRTILLSLLAEERSKHAVAADAGMTSEKVG